ncbi:MAG: hypothetical protein ACLFTK_08715 [Anaerolineales bacterium]
MPDESPPNPSPTASVGAPSELADAHEMPGCIQGAVTMVYAIPYFLFRELPTLPLDVLVYAHERGGWRLALVALAGQLILCGGVCWATFQLMT